MNFVIHFDNVLPNSNFTKEDFSSPPNQTQTFIVFDPERKEFTALDAIFKPKMLSIDHNGKNSKFQIISEKKQKQPGDNQFINAKNEDFLTTTKKDPSIRNKFVDDFNKILLKERKQNTRKLFDEDSNIISFEKIKDFNELQEVEFEKTKMCQICYEYKNVSNFYTIFFCSHSFCYNCIQSYLKEKIRTFQILEISCPAGCDFIFSDDEIQKIFLEDPQVFEKYKNLLNQAKINSDPKNLWCPVVKCNNLIRRKGNETKVQCDKCGQMICFNCRLRWHGKTTCEKALEKEFHVAKKKLAIKNCPKCKSRIEKSGGCNHMKCSFCNHEFCWLCRNQYNFGHYAITNILGCPGLQFAEIKSSKKKILFFCYKMLLTFLVFPIAIFLAIPLLIVIGPFALSIHWLTEKYYAYYFEPEDNPQRIIVAVVLGMVGIIFTPIILLLVLLPKIIRSLMDLIQKFLYKEFAIRVSH